MKQRADMIVTMAENESSCDGLSKRSKGEQSCVTDTTQLEATDDGPEGAARHLQLSRPPESVLRAAGLEDIHEDDIAYICVVGSGNDPESPYPSPGLPPLDEEKSFDETSVHQGEFAVAVVANLERSDSISTLGVQSATSPANCSTVQEQKQSGCRDYQANRRRYCPPPSPEKFKRESHKFSSPNSYGEISDLDLTETTAASDESELLIQVNPEVSSREPAKRGASTAESAAILHSSCDPTEEVIDITMERLKELKSNHCSTTNGRHQTAHMATKRIIKKSQKTGTTTSDEKVMTVPRKEEKKTNNAVNDDDSCDAVARKLAKKRDSALKKHYKGNVLQISQARGTCDALDALVCAMKEQTSRWFKQRVRDVEDTSKLLREFNKSMNELKLNTQELSRRAGLGKSRKKATRDSRSSVEIKLTSDFFVQLQETIVFMKDWMFELGVADPKLSSTTKTLANMWAELMERNVRTLATLRDPEAAQVEETSLRLNSIHSRGGSAATVDATKTGEAPRATPLGGLNVVATVGDVSVFAEAALDKSPLQGLLHLSCRSRHGPQQPDSTSSNVLKPSRDTPVETRPCAALLSDHSRSSSKRKMTSERRLRTCQYTN